MGAAWTHTVRGCVLLLLCLEVVCFGGFLMLLLGVVGAHYLLSQPCGCALLLTALSCMLLLFLLLRWIAGW